MHAAPDSSWASSGHTHTLYRATSPTATIVRPREKLRAAPLHQARGVGQLQEGVERARARELRVGHQAPQPLLQVAPASLHQVRAPVHAGQRAPRRRLAARHRPRAQLLAQLRAARGSPGACVAERS